LRFDKKLQKPTIPRPKPDFIYTLSKNCQKMFNRLILIGFIFKEKFNRGSKLSNLLGFLQEQRFIFKEKRKNRGSYT